MRLRGLLVVLLLAGCQPEAQTAHPALWQIDGPQGQKGWLFGTIHALERPALWRSAEIDAALRETDRIVVEMSDSGEDAGKVLASLAHTPGQPPLSARVAPALRPALVRLLKRTGLSDTGFADTETWAAALSLAQAAESDNHSDYGIDRAVLKASQGKRVAELEGASIQLALFDRLPEQDQRDLLASVISEADDQVQTADLAQAWRKGDMAAIERETRRGLLADPELRQVLFTRRNVAWAATISASLARGERAFVAVGAAHMAGPEGLPALLTARGLTVRRVQ